MINAMRQPSEEDMEKFFAYLTTEIDEASETVKGIRALFADDLNGWMKYLLTIQVMIHQITEAFELSANLLVDEVIKDTIFAWWMVGMPKENFPPLLFIPEQKDIQSALEKILSDMKAKAEGEGNQKS